MKTYKLPIILESEDDKSYIKDLCRQQSIIVRSAYNDLKNGKTTKELEHQYKNLKSTKDMDSWFIKCGIFRGKYLTHKKDLIFGGKHNFAKLLKGKITKEEWKAKRLYSLYLQGEVHHGGNRKFKLGLENNLIIFKPKLKKKITIKIPKIRSKWKHELAYIQEIGGCFTIRLSTSHIEITIDESHFACQNYQQKVGRVLGIDLNPDYIGWSITDQPSGKIITKQCYKTTNLNKKSGKSSNAKESKYLTNKRKHEYIHIVKDIIKQAQHYRTEKIVIEDLNIKSQDYSNKYINRKNNMWMRRFVTTKLKMDCNVNGIKYIEVNPAYSSIIGNLVYDSFDPINASLEIGRRGFYRCVKGKLYPSLESVKHQWKETVTEDIKTWKDLFLKIKTLNIRYRVPLDESQVGLSINNRKACIKKYMMI